MVFLELFGVVVCGYRRLILLWGRIFGLVRYGLGVFLG